MYASSVAARPPSGKRRILLPPPQSEGRQGNPGGNGGDGKAALLAEIHRLARQRRGKVSELTSLDTSLRHLLGTLKEEERMQILFEHWARSYNRDMKEHAQAVRRILRKLKHSIRGHVVDLSTGTGLVPLTIQQFGGVQSVLANDLSPAMLAIARRTLKDYPLPIAFECKGAVSLVSPQPAGSVFLSQTLHLLPNHGRAMVIVNAYRMLEAGGNFFLIDEWPARVRPVHDLISALLDSVFHPIGLDDLRRSIQTDIRLLVERESHITDIQDSSGRTTHQMYGIRFEKIG